MFFQYFLANQKYKQMKINASKGKF